MKRDVLVYTRLRVEACLEGLEESIIDHRALNCLHTVPCTEKLVKDEDSDDEESNGIIEKVSVVNFSLKSGAEDCECFLKQSDKVKTVKRLFVKRLRRSLRVPVRLPLRTKRVLASSTT